MISARVAILPKPGQVIFKQEQLDPDALGEGQLICESLWTAISPGTEVAAYVGAPPLRSGVTYPRLVGYCNVAEVLHCGPGTPGIATGDRVLSFASHCSHFLIHRNDILAKVPTAIPAEAAACAYLFHLGYSALLSADVRLGSTVVILGLGVVGLGAVAVAALAGASVFGISNQAQAREHAVAMGAIACFDRSRMPDLMHELGESRAHAVITTSNDWDDWPIALECAGTRGTIAVLGFPGRQQSHVPTNPFNSAQFYARQLRIIAVGLSPERSDSRGHLPFNERDNLHRILNWIGDGSLDPERLVSEKLDAGDLQEAYERLSRREGSPLTFLLRWKN